LPAEEWQSASTGVEWTAGILEALAEEEDLAVPRELIE